MVRTLQKSRCAIWYEFDEDFAAAVYDQAVQRRLLVVFEQLVTGFVHASLSLCEQFDGIPVGVLQQEPASDFDNGGVVGVAHRGGIEAVQRHGAADTAGGRWLLEGRADVEAFSGAPGMLVRVAHHKGVAGGSIWRRQ